MIYQKVRVQQGSPEWLELRRSKVTASQMPVLLGIDPYQKVSALYREKLTGQERKIDDFKLMLFARGHEAEAAARIWVEEHMGMKFPPEVLVSVPHPDLMASLDGFHEAKDSVLLEAKYVGKAALEDVKHGVVKPHHLCQVQAQLLVSRASRCIYFATDESGDAAMLDIFPDETRFPTMVHAAEEFMRCLRNLVIPESPEVDYYTPKDDPRFKRLFQLNAEVDALKKELIEAYKDHGRILCDGVKIVRSLVKGSVKYSEIPELRGVDLEKYRGRSINRVTVSYQNGSKVDE